MRRLIKHSSDFYRINIFSLAFFLLLFIYNHAFSQADSLVFVPDNPPAAKGFLNTQRSYIFIDLTNNTWVNRPGNIDTKIISGGFNFNLTYDFHIIKSNFSIAPGISFSNSTVKNNSYYYYLNINGEEKGFTQLAPYPDTLDILKNKFSASYLDVPIELRIRIKPEQKGKNFWIAPGFRAGILISDFWKLKYTESNGDISKTKVYGIANIEKYHYGISLRAGYYKFGIYSFLALNNLFEKDKGPELTPFSLGITFTPF